MLNQTRAVKASNKIIKAIVPVGLKSNISSCSTFIFSLVFSRTKLERNEEPFVYRFMESMTLFTEN